MPKLTDAQWIWLEHVRRMTDAEGFGHADPTNHNRRVDAALRTRGYIAGPGNKSCLTETGRRILAGRAALQEQDE